MGGDRETILKAGQQPATEGAPLQLGAIRVHQAGGEVHFHDDAAKLKCAVPVPVWWEAWKSLQLGDGCWTYIDSANGTYLYVDVETVPVEPGPETFITRVTVKIRAVRIDPNFLALHQFTRRK